LLGYHCTLQVLVACELRMAFGVVVRVSIQHRDQIHQQPSLDRTRRIRTADVDTMFKYVSSRNLFWSAAGVFPCRSLIATVQVQKSDERIVMSADDVPPDSREARMGQTGYLPRVVNRLVNPDLRP
jgi:hypothetical protein